MLKRLFNRDLREKVTTLEVVVDALIGVLTHKKLMTRTEIQRQIIEQAGADTEEAKHGDVRKDTQN